MNNCSTTTLFGLGNGCAIYFIQISIVGILLAAKTAKNWNGVNAQRKWSPCLVIQVDKGKC